MEALVACIVLCLSLVGVVVTSALLYASLSVVVTACVMIVLVFLLWFVAFILRPRQRRDHYERQFSEYPYADPRKLPRRG